MYEERRNNERKRKNLLQQKSQRFKKKRSVKKKPTAVTKQMTDQKNYESLLIATRRQEKRTIRLVASALDRDLSLPDTDQTCGSVVMLTGAGCEMTSLLPDTITAMAMLPLYKSGKPGLSATTNITFKQLLATKSNMHDAMFHTLHGTILDGVRLDSSTTRRTSKRHNNFAYQRHRCYKDLTESNIDPNETFRIPTSDGASTSVYQEAVKAMLSPSSKILVIVGHSLAGETNGQSLNWMKDPKYLPNLEQVVFVNPDIKTGTETKIREQFGISFFDPRTATGVARLALRADMKIHLIQMTAKDFATALFVEPALTVHQTAVVADVKAVIEPMNVRATLKELNMLEVDDWKTVYGNSATHSVGAAKITAAQLYEEMHLLWSKARHENGTEKEWLGVYIS